MEVLPLFPLGLVLLPGELVPLHIFEPRYRELVADLEGPGEPDELVIAQAVGEEGVVATIATAAGLVDVVERFDDGRTNIVVQGRRRVRIAGEEEGRSYRQAACEDVPDEPQSPVDAALLDEVRGQFAELAKLADREQAPPEPRGDEGPAFALAARIDFGPEIKQSLLEILDENLRLRLLSARMRDAMRGMAVVATARERASSNGKVGH